jgi:hypothetical protein
MEKTSSALYVSVLYNENQLPSPVYILYTFINMLNVNILYIMTNDLLLQTITLTKDRPVLSSERVPNNNKTITVKQ